MNLMKSYQLFLEEFLGFKSISTDLSYKEVMLKTARFLGETFKGKGFQVKLLNHPKLNPVVFAEYHLSDHLPTLLIYGHYDVQPASQEEWGYNPFQLTMKSNRFYGRGIVDNKGQISIHITTAFQLLKEGKLAYNLKFLIEGNEETGSVEELAELMIKHKNILKTNYVLISDGELVGGKPTIEASFRGGFNARLEYRVAKTAVHSGLFGGAVANAIQQMTAFIHQLVDENNHVFLPGFYEGIKPPTKEEEANNQQLLKLAGNPALEAGFKSLRLDKGENFYTTTGFYPTIQVTGIKGGYIGNGFANIVPAQAEARFNFRLVEPQKSHQVYEQFANFVKEKTPGDVEYHLEATGFHEPVKIDVSEVVFTQARKILEEVYQPPILYHYVGAAIPVIVTFKKLFNINPLSVGLANEDCHMHGIDENFRLDLIQKGLEFSYNFLQTPV